MTTPAKIQRLIDQVQALHDWLGDLLPAVYAALREAAPELHPMLRPP